MRSNRFILLCLTALIYITYPIGTLAAPKSEVPFYVEIPNRGEIKLYGQSHALLIDAGNSTGGWPRLDHVPQEHAMIEAVLNEHGFNVIKRRPETSQELKIFLNEFIKNNDVAKDNRLLFFFSGYGHTVGSESYFVPPDAPDPQVNNREFYQKALSIYEVVRQARQLNAKHVLFVFDSCFKGPRMIRQIDDTFFPPLADRVTEKVIEFIISGDGGQQLPGKSDFAQFFVDALKGGGDLNRDRYITGSELGNFLFNKLTQKRFMAQIPQYGKIPGQNAGDFLFANLKAGSSSQGADSQCLSIKTNIPDFFPISLYNTWKGHEERDFLYWFNIEAENRCGKKRTIEIEFNTLDGPIRKRVTEPTKVEIPQTKQGETFKDNIKPPFVFTNTNFDGITHVRISWNIKGQNVFGDEPPIEVRPRNVYTPTLLSADGKSAPQKFILASLSAWALSKGTQLKERSEKEFIDLIQSGDSPTATNWFKQLYKSLFWQKPQIRVFAPQFPFPLQKTKKISTPEEILGTKFADHLEAALLLAAVSKTRKHNIANLRPTLIYQAEGKKYFFAWRSPENDWLAIDIGQISTQADFDENRKRATTELMEALKTHQNIKDELDKGGVFIGQKVVAIDFYQTSEGPHKIMGLP